MARLNLEDTLEATVVPAAISADALFELGMMYSAGREVEPDMVVAHRWFNLAAVRGNDRAKFYRIELSREMSRKQIAQAQREAREWLKRH